MDAVGRHSMGRKTVNFRVANARYEPLEIVRPNDPDPALAQGKFASTLAAMPLTPTASKLVEQDKTAALSNGKCGCFVGAEIIKSVRRCHRRLRRVAGRRGEMVGLNRQRLGQLADAPDAQAAFIGKFRGIRLTPCRLRPTRTRSAHSERSGRPCERGKKFNRIGIGTR